MKNKKIGLIFGVLLLVIGFFLFNDWVIEWTMTGSDTITLEYGQKYEEPGMKATLHASLFPFYKRDVPITTTSNINPSKIGHYTVEYHVDTPFIEQTKRRAIHIQDTTPPTIILVSDAESFTLPNHPYEEEGFQAVDAYDGDLTDHVQRQEKDGKVIYTVKDSSGNIEEVTRTIRYDDVTAPVLSIGEKTIYLTEGDTFEDSYSAQDDALGDITSSVVVDGTVDTQIPGAYELTYRVKDSFENESIAHRTVIVQSKPKPTPPPQSTNTEKVAYLTFDDGPSAYTSTLLDKLASYDAKATFFVTGFDSEYASHIGRAYREGHAIGAHTFSHDYSSIYSSESAFWEDNQRIAQRIEEQTGSWPNLLRFPGGSSNTVSRFNPGIMTRLAQEASAYGYVYFDWNVSSGDAGETKDASVVASNIIEGIQSHKTPIILCHDVKSYTIDAMDTVLSWCKENGYHLEALTPESPTMKHTIVN